MAHARLLLHRGHHRDFPEMDQFLPQGTQPRSENAVVIREENVHW